MPPSKAFTQEQMDKAAELLAKNTSTRAIANALGLTWGRANTLVNKLEVMEAAHKIRMTSLVPEQLNAMMTLMSAMVDAMGVVESRQGQLEKQMRKMNKAVWQKNLQINKQRDTIRSMRERERELRALIRKRGFVE